jgi:hypothetical protein
MNKSEYRKGYCPHVDKHIKTVLGGRYGCQHLTDNIITAFSAEGSAKDVMDSAHPMTDGVLTAARL